MDIAADAKANASLKKRTFEMSCQANFPPHASVFSAQHNVTQQVDIIEVFRSEASLQDVQQNFRRNTCAAWKAKRCPFQAKEPTLEAIDENADSQCATLAEPQDTASFIMQSNPSLELESNPAMTNQVPSAEGRAGQKPSVTDGASSPAAENTQAMTN